MPSTFLDVDPRTLHVPPSRLKVAVPAKLARQLKLFGTSIQGMPILEVSRGAKGELMINSGVTRATRVAKFLPGQTIRVEVIDDLPHCDMSKLPKIGDLIP